MNIEEVINVLKNKDNSKELYFCEKNKDSYEDRELQKSRTNSFYHQ